MAVERIPPIVCMLAKHRGKNVQTVKLPVCTRLAPVASIHAIPASNLTISRFIWEKFTLIEADNGWIWKIKIVSEPNDQIADGIKMSMSLSERVSGELTEWRAIAQAKRQQTHKQVVNWNPRDLLAMRIHAPIKWIGSMIAFECGNRRFDWK